LIKRYRDYPFPGAFTSLEEANEYMRQLYAALVEEHRDRNRDFSVYLPYIDEDDMASDSSDYVPTQQSVKKYVDDSVVTDHGGLSGRADDDHDQYLLVDGTRAMIADLDMGGSNFTNTGACARAYLTAAQDNITNNTNTKVTLDTESFDLDADFDIATNYRFTAPVTGYYHIDARIGWSGTTANSKYQCRVYKNGTAGTLVAYDMRVSDDGGEDVVPRISDVIALTANDYLELWAYHNDGGNTPDLVTGEYNTFLTARLVRI
jgi:hypothetical protein